MSRLRTLAPRLVALLTVCAALSVAPASQAAVPTSTTSVRTAATATISLTTARSLVLRYTNNYRRAHGLRPFVAHTCLDRRVAQPWAVRMARTGVFAHRNLSTVFDICPGFSTLGENIAAGQQTPRAVVIAWMHSPGHRANILNPRFTRLGVGYAVSAGGRPYWVQNFAG